MGQHVLPQTVATLAVASALAFVLSAATDQDALLAYSRQSLLFVRNGAPWTPPPGRGVFSGTVKALAGASSFLLLYPGHSSFDHDFLKVNWETGVIGQTIRPKGRVYGDRTVAAVDEARGLLVWAWAVAGVKSEVRRCNLSDCSGTTVMLGPLPGDAVPTELRWYDPDRVAVHAGSGPVLWNVWTGAQSNWSGGHACRAEHGPIQAPDGHVYYSCGSTIYRDAEVLLTVEGAIDLLDYDARDNRVFWLCAKRWLRATTKGPGSAVGVDIPLGSGTNSTDDGFAPRVPRELLTMPCPAGSERGARGCQKCRRGTTDNDSSSATPCKDCGAGTYMGEVGQTGECQTCPAGSYYMSAWGPCLPCPKGSYTPTEGWRGSCITCPPGRHLESPIGPCVACPAGTSDDDNDSTTACKPCAPWSFTATANISGPCTTCNPGNYLSSSSGPCTQCALGSTDHDSNPSTQCAKCDQGLTTPVGRTGACLLCNAGHFLQGPQGPCEVCQPGFRDTDNSPATPHVGPCVECSAGSEWDSSSSACLKCSAGFTDADSNASTPCVLCSAGRHTAEGHSGACDQCPAGTSDTDSDPRTECATI
eukprot:m51a1_g909 putative protein serine threonine (589) ;mRNA; r:111791-116865